MATPLAHPEHMACQRLSACDSAGLLREADRAGIDPDALHYKHCATDADAFNPPYDCHRVRSNKIKIKFVRPRPPRLVLRL